MPCRAGSPVYNNLLLHWCLLCVLCAPCCFVLAAFSFSLVIHSGSFSCCGQCFVSVVLADQSGAAVYLSLIRSGVCQKCSSTKLQGTFPVSFPERLSLMGRACDQTSCLPLTPCWGCSLTSLCSYLPLTPGQESL